MFRFLVCATLLFCLVSPSVAERAPQSRTTSTCDFQDGRQLSVRYSSQAPGKDNPREGKVWVPGGAPVYLFTGAPLLVNDSEIPSGAYSLYVIPEKDNWTLVVNKNVSDANLYDEHQDILRVPMQIGEISQPDKHLRMVFAHVAPKQCNMRIYSGKTGTWAEFKEK